MTETDEYQDLARLVEDPGWTRLKALFEREWGKSGERYTTALESLLNTANREEAVQNVQLVVMVRREMTGFFQQIESRVRDLAHRADPVVRMSRRGTL